MRRLLEDYRGKSRYKFAICTIQTIAIYLSIKWDIRTLNIFPFYIIFINDLSQLFLSVIYNYVRIVVFEINADLELTPPLNKRRIGKAKIY